MVTPAGCLSITLCDPRRTVETVERETAFAYLAERAQAASECPKRTRERTRWAPIREYATARLRCYLNRHDSRSRTRTTNAQSETKQSSGSSAREAPREYPA